MKRMNTHSVYQFALRINPLTHFEYSEDMTMQVIFFALVRAELAIRAQLDDSTGFFSRSLKRSAGALLRSFYELGLKPDAEIFKTDLKASILPYQLNDVVQKAKDFETVLANELPGLATYVVSQKGIYSTDELISSAETHIPERYRHHLSIKAEDDIQRAGKCLAFEVPTASAFHMWRAVESVMNTYYEQLTGNNFEKGKVTRNWGQYIEALKRANADEKITAFLDHIRESYRNPIAHPEESVKLDDAFGLFGAALSVIGQMLRCVSEMEESLNADSALSALGGLSTVAGLPAEDSALGASS